MPTEIDTQTSTNAKASISAAKARANSSTKCDNTTLDTGIETLDKTRQTKVVDRCGHNEPMQEKRLHFQGKPVEKQEEAHQMGSKVFCQIVMTAVFCGAEFTVGLVSSSIAMLADAYHMAADVMALVVAYVCIKMATKPPKGHGYGWVRAETLGGFINGVFLATVCVMIFQEAIGRVLNPHMLTSPLTVITIGIIGLLINLIGLFNVGGHGHSHGGGGGHGHSHGGGKSKKKSDDHGHSHENGHGHSHDHAENHCNNRGAAESARPEALFPLLDNEDMEIHIERRLSGVESQNAILETIDRQMTPYGTHIASDIFIDKTVSESSTNSSGEKKPKRRLAFWENVNLRGVWLHLLSDAFGSVIVIISAFCVYKWPEWTWSPYIDPCLSLVLATIMSCTSVVLIKNSGRKLLMTAPKGLNVPGIKKDLELIMGVSKVDNIRVWTLCGQRIIASVHVRVCHPGVFEKASFKIKNYFHDLGVHSTTIEPTFEESCMQTMQVTSSKKSLKLADVKQPATVSIQNEVTQNSAN